VRKWERALYLGMKVCPCCGEDKPVSEYGPVSLRKSKDGLQGYCRACNNQQGAHYDLVRVRAREMARRALARGEITPQPCERCGATERVEMHHDDYLKPKVVRFLCIKHHKDHHRGEPKRRGRLRAGYGRRRRESARLEASRA
jgi:hypothetical protein